MSHTATQGSRWRRAPVLCLALAWLVLPPAAGVRAEPAAEAIAFVRAFSDHTLALLAAPAETPSARAEALRRLVQDGLEIEAISRFALGRRWGEASEGERREYRRVYEDYIVRTLAQRFSNYGGETIAVGSARSAGGSDVLVASTLSRPVGAPLRIDWRVRPTAEGWRIVDLIVEGMSLAVTQRDEFAAVLRDGGGLPALVATLRQRTASL